MQNDPKEDEPDLTDGSAEDGDEEVADTDALPSEEGIEPGPVDSETEASDPDGNPGA